MTGWGWAASGEVAVRLVVVLDAHRRLRWRIPALWLTYLIAYATFTTIRGEILATPDEAAAAIAVRTRREVFGCPRPEDVVVRIGH